MNLIERLLAQRDDAALRGDGGIVREITDYLTRIGYVDVPDAVERAVPKRQRRTAS